MSARWASIGQPLAHQHHPESPGDGARGRREPQPEAEKDPGRGVEPERRDGDRGRAQRGHCPQAAVAHTQVPANPLQGRRQQHVRKGEYYHLQLRRGRE